MHLGAAPCCPERQVIRGSEASIAAYLPASDRMHVLAGIFGLVFVGLIAAELVAARWRGGCRGSSGVSCSSNAAARRIQLASVRFEEADGFSGSFLDEPLHLGVDRLGRGFFGILVDSFVQVRRGWEGPVVRGGPLS